MTGRRAPKRSRRERRYPMGSTGASWVFTAQQPVPAITTNLEDGTEFVLDHWQLASAVTLMALWADDGVLRLPASGWELAREDVQRGYRWGVALERRSADEVVLQLHDTRQTEPHRLELVDVTLGRNGKPRVTRSVHVAPEPGISGDPETDTHLAIMLSLLRERGGTLSVRLSDLAAVARLLQVGHEWQVVELPFAGSAKVFRLKQPPRDAMAR